MARFPAPTYTKIIEPNTDSQMVSVPLEEMGFGARKVSQEKTGPNGMRIKHISNEKK